MAQVWQPTRLTRQQLEERRLAAQPLLNDPEWSTASIAEHFGVKPGTVRVWRVRLKERGSLEATLSSGRPTRLNDAQVAEIIGVLQEAPDPERFPDWAAPFVWTNLNRGPAQGEYTVLGAAS